MLSFSFLLRGVRKGRLTRTTPLTLAVALFLLISLPFTAWVTPFWQATWPAITTLAWSIGVFFAVVNYASRHCVDKDINERIALCLKGPTTIYLLLGMSLASISLLGINIPDKFLNLPLLRWLPIGGNSFHPNEVGGMLTLFFPFAFALWINSWQLKSNWPKRLVSFSLLLACALFAGLLLLTQSRSSILGIAVGIFLILLSAGRRGQITLGLAAILTTTAVILSGPERVLNRLLFAGANAPASILGPRLRIWQQALHSIRDFSLTGMGLGVFGEAAPRLYPQVPIQEANPLADAHNLYLQTAADFGLIGFFAFLVILILALAQLIKLLGNGRVKGFSRYWTLGLLGSLAAHLIYSVTDAVALGTRPGVALWFLLGLIAATAVSQRPRSLKRPHLRPRSAAFYILAILITGVWVWYVFPLNKAAHLTAKAFLDDADRLAAIEPQVAELAEQHCHVYWYDGLLQQAMEQERARDRAWAKLLNCTDRFIPFMFVLAPENRTMAAWAVKKQPANAEGYFWLAQITAVHSPEAAISLYRQGLALAPRDGRRWVLLGHLLAENDPQAALEAYAQACAHSDPGANGCWRAGQTAETQGDLETAISFYRLSHWPPARQRADQLEQTLQTER